jgi:hypothetical protein
MVWLNLSPIPVGRKGVISPFKLFLPVFATRRARGEGVGAPWFQQTRLLSDSFKVICSGLVRALQLLNESYGAVYFTIGKCSKQPLYKKKSSKIFLPQRIQDAINY